MFLFFHLFYLFIIFFCFFSSFFVVFFCVWKKSIFHSIVWHIQVLKHIFVIQIITHTKKQKLMSFYKEQNDTITHKQRRNNTHILHTQVTCKWKKVNLNWWLNYLISQVFKIINKQLLKDKGNKSWFEYPLWQCCYLIRNIVTQVWV